MKIAYKEAKETEYGLLLCNESEEYAKPGKLLIDVQSVFKVIGKIISFNKTQTPWLRLVQ
jgi:hypothetical protein